MCPHTHTHIYIYIYAYKIYTKHIYIYIYYMPNKTCMNTHIHIHIYLTFKTRCHKIVKHTQSDSWIFLTIPWGQVFKGLNSLEINIC